MSEEKKKSTDPEKEEQNAQVADKSKKKKKATSAKSKEAKKIAVLEEKVSALEEERGQLKDQMLRKMAEFENYKRRTEKEFLAHLENANENLITELLPSIDDFERFLEHAEKDDNNASLKDGVALIVKNIFDVLNKKGLKVMETIGQEFDTDKHEALMQVDSDEYGSGLVAGQHLKGYLLNDKVIRHAQVLVVK